MGPSLKLSPLSLRLFLSVVGEGTIAAAAARENISAAAVSKRLSELEAMLDTRLLIRTNKGITVTTAGFYLAFMARGVLTNLDDIAVQMKGFSDGRRGTVRVLANITAMTQFLPTLIKSFLDRYSEIHISLEESRSLAITRMIADNAAEIGVFTRLPHSANIELYPFRKDELKVLVPSNHPLSDRDQISFAEALDYDQVVLRSGTHLNFQLLYAASEVGKPLRAKLEVSAYDSLCLMVQSGLGIAILPGGSVSNYHIPDTRVIGLSEKWAKRELVIGVRSIDALSPVGRLFFDHLLPR